MLTRLSHIRAQPAVDFTATKCSDPVGPEFAVHEQSGVLEFLSAKRGGFRKLMLATCSGHLLSFLAVFCCNLLWVTVAGRMFVTKGYIYPRGSVLAQQNSELASIFRRGGKQQV